MSTTPTEVRPFANGSEADDWEWRNCERCTKRGVPDVEGVGPCAIETAVSMGRILGTIPSEIAVQAGATISEQVDTMQGTGYCHMPRECAELDLVMTCECMTDRRKRISPKCNAPAVGTVIEKGYRHPVCAKHKRLIERATSSAGAPHDGAPV